MECKYDGMYHLKNHLYHLDLKELEEVYLYNRTCYLGFLGNLDQLLDYDAYSLFLIKDAKENVLNLIMKYRETPKLHEEVLTETSNAVISKINLASQQLERDKLENYIIQQKETRCLSDVKYVPSMIAFDSEVIDGIENKTLEDLEDPQYVLSSIYYLFNFYNALYQHKEHINTVIDYIKKTSKHNGFIYYMNSKKMIKELKEQYQEL